MNVAGVQDQLMQLVAVNRRLQRALTKAHHDREVAELEFAQVSEALREVRDCLRRSVAMHE